MRSRVVLLGCALLLAACSLDRIGFAGGSSDAGGDLDAGLGLDAGGRSDGGAPDASSEVTDASVDSGIVPDFDAGVDAGQDAGVDAGHDAGPPPLRTCLDLYEELGETFELCAERETECEFYVDYETGTKCNTICAEAGGSCLHAYNDLGSRCGRGPIDDCNRSLDAQICVCSRVP